MKKFLIVDKLDQIVETVEREKKTLSQTGIRIFTASSGEEALKIHRVEKTDLIIADLNLPGMGGDRLCAAVRKDRALKNVAILLICFNNNSAIKRSESCGANFFITKPINREELLSKIRECLNVSMRKNLQVLMQIIVEGKFEEQFFFSVSQNISISGALIETEKDLEKGDKLTCAFFIGSGQITQKGEIVRVIKKDQDKYCYGVKFTDMSISSKTRIDEFVKDSQDR